MTKNLMIGVFCCLFSYTTASAQTRQEKFEVNVLRPMAGEELLLNDEQIEKAVDIIIQTDKASEFNEAMKNVGRRQDLEILILQYYPDAIKIEAAIDRVKPEDVIIRKDLEGIKLTSPLKEFRRWGDDPIVKVPHPTDWNIETLRKHRDKIAAATQKNTYSDYIKAEWVKQFQACLNIENVLPWKFGYCKEIDAAEWPYLQFITGAGSTTENIHYVPDRGQEGKMLAVFLPVAGMWVGHGYRCAGNPIVPFQERKFTATRLEGEKPQVVYVPKEVEKKVEVPVPIPGPEGKPGPRGMPGPKGERGDIGPRGPKGPGCGIRCKAIIIAAAVGAAALTAWLLRDRDKGRPITPIKTNPGVISPAFNPTPVFSVRF